MASTCVLRRLITRALDFGTSERRSTPATEYDFESEGDNEEDLSPKCGSWTEVLSSGVGLESGTEMERRRKIQRLTKKLWPVLTEINGKRPWIKKFRHY